MNNLFNQISQESLAGKQAIFKKQRPKTQSKLIMLLGNNSKKAMMNKLPFSMVIDFLHYLAPDDVTDLIQLVPRNKQKKFLTALKVDLKEKVEFLLKFNPKTAAGFMNLDYLLVKSNENVEKILTQIQTHEKRTGRVPVVLVFDKKLLGEYPLYKLALNKKINKDEIMVLPEINYRADKDAVIDVFKRNAHNKIVVLDDDSIMGIIYSDDILTLLEEKSYENMYNISGVVTEEGVMDNFWSKFKNRYKWLCLNLVTLAMASLIISFFDDIITKFVLLAVYMPIVTGMGGNAGTQAMAVMIRGLTLGEVNWKTAKQVIVNEILAGVINGLLIAIILGIFVSLFNGSLLLGIILALSIIINLALAGLFGAFMPILFKTLGADPAIASSVFITALTDIFGFFVFLGLASILL